MRPWLFVAVVIANFAYFCRPSSLSLSQIIPMPHHRNVSLIFSRMTNPHTSLGVHPFIVSVTQTKPITAAVLTTPHMRRVYTLLSHDACVLGATDWLTSSWNVVERLPSPLNFHSHIESDFYYSISCRALYSAVVPTLTAFSGFRMEMISQVVVGHEKVYVNETMMAHGPRALLAFAIAEGMRAHLDAFARWKD